MSSGCSSCGAKSETSMGRRLPGPAAAAGTKRGERVGQRCGRCSENWATGRTQDPHETKCPRRDYCCCTRTRGVRRQPQQRNYYCWAGRPEWCRQGFSTPQGGPHHGLLRQWAPATCPPHTKARTFPLLGKHFAAFHHFISSLPAGQKSSEFVISDGKHHNLVPSASGVESGEDAPPTVAAGEAHRLA